MSDKKIRSAIRQACRSRQAVTAVSLSLLACALPASAAEDTSDDVALPTLTVEGNRLYEMAPSEETGGYGVEAATVGTKTPASVRDIPQSITVLTRDYLDDRDVTHIDDAAKLTPGLRTLSNDSGRSSIYSRGYEYDELNIDGLPAPLQSIFGTLPSLSAFDRMEVMRGPSGLFNSTSELGGIINLVRKRATVDTQGSLQAGYGSWDRNRLSADVSGSLNESGSVRGRVVASREDMPNEVDENENVDESYYGTLDIDVTDATELSLAVLHQTKDITPSNGLPAFSDGSLADWDRSTFLGADWNNFENETTDLFLDLTHQFDNGGYGRFAVRQSHREGDYYYAFTGSALGDDGSTSLRTTQRDFEQDALSMDASYSQPFEALGHVSEFVVGADYKHYDTDYLNGASNLGSINVNTFDASSVTYSDPTYSQRIENELTETGVYGKLTFRPLENLALIAGSRFSWYDLSADTTALSTDTTTESDGDGSGEWTPYAGAVLDVDEHHSLYASYSEVFNPQTETDENGDLIDPREGEQYEIGIKGAYDNGRLNSRLSVFQLTDKNRAATPYDEDGNAISSYSEATGEARVRGFEAELSGQYGPWDLLVGYTYMDTEKLAGDTNTLFMLMPHHTVNAWSKYTFHQSGLLNQLSLGAGVTAMSDFYLERGSTSIEAPGYAVVDALISKRFTENLSASLNVNNVFDRKYYSRVGSVATFNFYGPSRNVMANVSYDF
ncbi:TonB-dependent siderophore receptor [Marinobacter sp. JSM 1782161]|uniref:TonB-dependent siderophore receptor n=1 Tax=Marinobacter sp. JSM 1782161 TaxID=2685906 RepID=UPI0014033A5A|nr:TonB-dependent siderophore receptor [Marinobacter sp. JSM 1782161]